MRTEMSVGTIFKHPWVRDYDDNKPTTCIVTQNRDGVIYFRAYRPDRTLSSWTGELSGSQSCLPSWRAFAPVKAGLRRQPPALQYWQAIRQCRTRRRRKLARLVRSHRPRFNTDQRKFPSPSNDPSPCDDPLQTDHLKRPARLLNDCGKTARLRRTHFSRARRPVIALVDDFTNALRQVSPGKADPLHQGCLKPLVASTSRSKIGNSQRNNHLSIILVV